jgi:hypothetical protein
MARGPCLDCADDPLTQILGIGLRHRSSPESSIRKDSPIRPTLRIPAVPLSIQTDRIML